MKSICNELEVKVGTVINSQCRPMTTKTGRVLSTLSSSCH